MTQWVHVSIDLPERAADGGAEPDDFWSTALGWPLGQPWRQHPEFRSFTPTDGATYVHRQRITGPSRVHLDIEVPDLAAQTDVLVGHGARLVRRTADWHTLTSPGGWEFCLVAQHEHGSRPAPVRWSQGHRTRLVQICIDSPPQWLDREVTFWRAALDWRWQDGSAPEFVGKLIPESGSPVQILLHRLGDDDGGSVTRAHIDLGTDDREAEADRLVQAGATRMWSGDGWVALRDPAGMLFCATDNSPDAP